MLSPPVPKLARTRQELAQHDGTHGSYWTAIDGEVYDISEFVRAHPGGSIIRLAAGRDATILLESYHPTASLGRVRRALKNEATHLGPLISEANGNEDPTFYRVIRQRVDRYLKTRGLDRHGQVWRSMVETGLVLTVFALAWYARAVSGSYLAAIVCGLMLGRIGFLMHTGNHCATTRYPWGNRLMGMLMDFAGGSSRVWSVDHQLAHHEAPNVHGKDNDCEIANPLLRFHPHIGRRWWHRFQHIITFSVMSMGLLKWVFSDVVDHAKGRVGNTPFHVSFTDWVRVLSFKGSWLLMHLFIPAALVGWGTAVGTMVVMMVVGAYYTESIFIVNHIQPDLVPKQHEHWAVAQVRATSNGPRGHASPTDFRGASTIRSSITCSRPWPPTCTRRSARLCARPARNSGCPTTTSRDSTARGGRRFATWPNSVASPRIFLVDFLVD